MIGISTGVFEYQTVSLHHSASDSLDLFASSTDGFVMFVGDSPIDGYLILISWTKHDKTLTPTIILGKL